MAKRDLFDELMLGFDELKQERDGKITLKTTQVEEPKPIAMSKTKIAKIRKDHNYSQAVFARVLATKVGTLRNWEQGLAEPNAQAKLLLKMVEVDGSILKQLAEITTGTAAVQAKYAVNKVAAKRKRVVKKKAAAKAPAKKKAVVKRKHKAPRLRATA